MIEIAILIIAVSLLLFAYAAVIYVAYRFLALAIAQDMQLLREINFLQRILPAGSPSVLNRFHDANTKPTDGEFINTTDEEYAVAEQVRRIKSETGYMSEEEEKELEAQIRQGGVTVPE